MGVLVHKYGGTSVGSIEKMRNVARRVIKDKKRGYDLVVVVSAMGKTTDQLVSLAKEITEQPNAREMDVLLSTGEQISIALLTMMFQSLGYEAVSLTGWQAGIKTEGLHTKSKIREINRDKIKSYLTEGKIVIVAGFQGINEIGEITTLGRGGSDTTAVALAATFGCPCHIYTDVDGIYSVDPRVYQQAKKLVSISYEEMMEMASLGATVMEPRAIGIGRKYNIPIYVASSMSETSGTYIKEYDEMIEENVITGLSISDNVVMVTISQIPYEIENIAMIFEKLAYKQINVDMISQAAPQHGYVTLSFTIAKEDLLTLQEVLKEIGDFEISIEDEISKLSVVGMGMRNHSGVSGHIFRIFANHRIPFLQVTTSEISISYTIRHQDKDLAVRTLSESLGL